MNKKNQLHSFARSTPELVYHIATHKHVPLMEKNVIEAVRKNIWGTQVVGEAALNFGT